MTYPILPDVSIVMPIYNSGKYIVECLDSVRAQQFCNYELILINDKSTDQTDELIKEYLHKANDSRILYYENEHNFGPSFSRNKGLYMARGKYVCFCDSDEKLEGKKFEGIQVCSVKETCLRYPDANYLVSGRYSREMYQMLKELDIRKIHILFI